MEYPQLYSIWYLFLNSPTPHLSIVIYQNISIFDIYILLYISLSIYIYPPWKSIDHHISITIFHHIYLVQALRPSTGHSHLGGLSRLIFAASPVGPKTRCHVGLFPRDSAPRAEKPSDTKALGGNQPVVRSAWDQRDLASLIIFGELGDEIRVVIFRWYQYVLNMVIICFLKYWLTCGNHVEGNIWFHFLSPLS